jgi:hypothetical protein
MLVIPAKAGIPFVLATAPEEHWIPAFAGMTEGAVEVSERSGRGYGYAIVARWPEPVALTRARG